MINRRWYVKSLAAAALTFAAFSAQVSSAQQQEFNQANDTLEQLSLNNRLLRERIQRQEELMVQLEDHVGYAAVLADEQNSPLLALIEEMMETLERFIEADLPFEIDSRRDQIAVTRNLVDNPEATIREKFQRLLSVYQVETNYGQTLSVYEDELLIDGVETEVRIVRVGRIALAYQTEDRTQMGAWDNVSRQWVELDPGTYRASLDRAINVASGLLSSEIINIPIHAPVRVQ